MTTTPFKNMLGALLEMSGGLQGRIDPSLRAVVVDLDMDRERYVCYFYYDGPIDEYKRELVSCAATEAATYWFADEHYIQLDYPAPIPVLGMLAYLRKEVGFHPPIIKRLPRNSKTLPESYLAYALQEGLLGRVIPSLRCVVVRIDEKRKRMGFFFYYDEEITEEIRKMSQEAIAIAKTAFSSDYTSVENIEFLPFPQDLSRNFPLEKEDPTSISVPNDGIKLVYERNEHRYD